MSSGRVRLLAVAAALAAVPAVRAQVCPFCMRAQFQLQVQMQRQQTMVRQAMANRFQQPLFTMRQAFTPHPLFQAGGRSFVPQAPRFGPQRTNFELPVTRTVQGTRTVTRRSSYRIEEEFRPHGPGHGPGYVWRRVREGSSVQTTVQRFTKQETHLQRFTRDRLTMKAPALGVRQREPARFLQTTPRQSETAGTRSGVTGRTERTPVDYHRPLAQLRVRWTASCGSCHSQPPAPTVARRPAGPLALPVGKPPAPSVQLDRRAAPGFAVPAPAQPGLVVGLPRQPLLAAVPPGLPPVAMRPPAAGPLWAALPPPALPGLVLGLARPAAPGFATRAPGERSPGEEVTTSPGGSLADSAPPLPPLEGSVALAVPARAEPVRPAAKVAPAAPLLPEDVAQAPPLPPLPGRSPLLIPAVPAGGRTSPAGLLLADLVALAPVLPPLPDEPPPEATQRE
jgi:alkylhydroperoxidase family enzyme